MEKEMSESKINKRWREFWNGPLRWPVFIVVLFAFLLGLVITGGSGKEALHVQPGVEDSEGVRDQIWSCSMHPQIKLSEPGQCPICGMDLIPVKKENSGELGPRELYLSPAAQKLASVAVTTVERRQVSVPVLLTGKVEFDETRIRTISARVPGRIDKLHVDFTGYMVTRGDPLVKLYSPELLTAQQELLAAIQSRDRLPGAASLRTKEMTQSLVDSARVKLRLLGLTEKQIKDLISRKKGRDHITIYSPLSGVVIHKNAVEGLYVKTGTPIYRLADLSSVWLLLDAYETDLRLVREGQTVHFETKSLPGEHFSGTIAFIDPFINPKTHTAKVRVKVANKEGFLKPDMLIHARLEADLDATGEVTGFDAKGQVSPLVIPVSAALITGERAVVYVAVPGKEGVFVGRDVTLGPRAGDVYLVREGLLQGETVVVNGAFKIDSDLQIKAEPSMMNPEGGGQAPGHDHGHSTPHAMEGDIAEAEQSAATGVINEEVPAAFEESLNDILSAYLALQEALSSDNFDGGREKSGGFIRVVKSILMAELPQKTHMRWMKEQNILLKNLESIQSSADPDGARIPFAPISLSIERLIRSFAPVIKGDLYRFHCPMALDNRGAFWLQRNNQTRNPYFGASMLTCQDLIEPLLGKGKKKEK